MKLSQKLKIFSQLFTSFLKSTFDFDHFEKKISLIAYFCPKIIDCEIRAYVNV